MRRDKRQRRAPLQDPPNKQWSIQVSKNAQTEVITIKPPKFETLAFRLVGSSPYMQARFSAKAMQAMKAKMEAGQTAKGKKQRDARDFDDDFRQAMHVSTEGWIGIPAAALRNACIDVCRMVGFKMTHAKMSIFVEADGLDSVDGTPLVRLIADAPEKTELAVRNQTGVVDIRVRPMWRSGRRLCASGSMATSSLHPTSRTFSRAGMQVGIGEGRPFSKESNGLGFGLFELRAAA